MQDDKLRIRVDCETSDAFFRVFDVPPEFTKHAVGAAFGIDAHDRIAINIADKSGADCPDCGGDGKVYGLVGGYTTHGSGYGDASPQEGWSRCKTCDGSGRWTATDSETMDVTVVSTDVHAADPNRVALDAIELAIDYYESLAHEAAELTDAGGVPETNPDCPECGHHLLDATPELDADYVCDWCTDHHDRDDTIRAFRETTHGNLVRTPREKSLVE